MLIKTAQYTSSYVDVAKCPADLKPEYAMIGRSNVGKSSLINYLCNHKGLAKVSNTPGKTQTINFFSINNAAWNLVDLPGYGFAKISQEQRKKWITMIHNYLEKREQMQCVFSLIDARIPPQALDLEFIAWLGEHSIPLAIAFTKADKSGKEILQNIEDFKTEMLKQWEELPPMFITSAEKKIGKESILEFIAKSNQEYKPIVH